VGGNAGRGRPRRIFLDQIGEVLEKVNAFIHSVSRVGRGACVVLLTQPAENKNLNCV
jgi:hypothetical protein